MNDDIKDKLFYINIVLGVALVAVSIFGVIAGFVHVAKWAMGF